MGELYLKAKPRMFDLSAEWLAAPIPVQQIGKGRFCTAYRQLDKPEQVYLVVKDGDRSKEILSNCLPIEGPHLPELERMGMMGDAYVWQTRYYERLTAKHKEAWAQYKILRDLTEKTWPTLQRRANYAYNAWGYDLMAAVVEGLADHCTAKRLDWWRLHKALEAVMNSAADYGASYTFEFAPRNLAVRADGKLILLDPVFDLDVTAADMAAARKKARGY